MLADRCALILLTAWAGALWSIGYLAAPTLFYTLGDVVLAGQLAGRMFTWVAYLGMLAGSVLIVHAIARMGARALKQGAFWILVVMLALTLAGHFGIGPMLEQARVAAEATDVVHSMFSDRFATWHGVASIAYLLESLLAVALVIKRQGV